MEHNAGRMSKGRRLGVESIVYSAFSVPVVALLIVQIQNFWYGLTTNERFGRDALRIEE
jgi:hypothetical protein